MVGLNYVGRLSRESVRKTPKKTGLSPGGSDHGQSRRPDRTNLPGGLIGECRKPFTDENGTEYSDYEYARNGTAGIFMVTEPLGAGVSFLSGIGAPVSNGPSVWPTPR